MRHGFWLVLGLAITPKPVAADGVEGVFAYDPSRITVGTVYHYVKTDIDGSHPEHISVYVAGLDRLEAFKFHPGPNRAALVTAWMDWSLFSARRMEAIQVYPDGLETIIAKLEYDASSSQLLMDVTSAQPPTKLPIPFRPWHVYGFDLSTLNFAMRHLVDPTKTFEFGVFLRGSYLGEVTVSFRGEESRYGIQCRKYEIDGPGLKGRGGHIWLDHDKMHFVDLEIELPDNPNWTSFKLRLKSVGHLTAQQWKQFRKDQFKRPVAQADALAVKALDHFGKGEWKWANSLYRRALKGNPHRGMDWFRRGYALLMLERFEEAIECFEQSAAMGSSPHASRYNMVCAHARQGQTDAALDALAELFARGYADDGSTLADDSDLDSIRHLPRYQAITGSEAPEGLSREAGWRYDLDYLASRLQEVHFHLYNKISPAELSEAIEAVKANVATMKDHRIKVEIQRILAMLGDGHTMTFMGLGRGGGFRRLPVEFYDFKDGLYVRSGDPRVAGLVGGRVVQIGKVDAATAMEAVGGLVSNENAMWVRQLGPVYLRVAEVLDALNLVEDMENIPLVVEMSDGERVSMTLEPGAYRGQTGDPFSLPANFVSANARADQSLPLYLRRPNDAWWFEYLDDVKVVYFQFNAVRNKSEETFASFTDRLFEFIDGHEVAALVIDMRNNSGGNNTLGRPLLHHLIRREALSEPGRLYVIAGRRTFSAAMNVAADIEFHTSATFVGEPTGSRPNFMGETSWIRLPYSRMKVSCSSRYFQHSFSDDYRIWIGPDIVAEMSSADFRNNHDPAMSAILERVIGR